MVFYPQTKLLNSTKQAWSAVVRQMRFLWMNPEWEKIKTSRENSCSQPPSSSGINVLRTMLRFIINALKWSNRENRNKCYPTFMPGKYGQTSIHPLISWIHPDGIGNWKGVLVNTPTLAWAYTRTFEQKGEEGIYNLIDIWVVSPMERDAVLSKWKNRKWVTKKYWHRNSN